jgi:hypothetical protein
MGDGVELERRREVAAERLFDDDAGVAASPAAPRLWITVSNSAGGIAR